MKIIKKYKYIITFIIYLSSFFLLVSVGHIDYVTILRQKDAKDIQPATILFMKYREINNVGFYVYWPIHKTIHFFAPEGALYVKTESEFSEFTNLSWR